MHARGLSAAWDAPLELRYQFADELDPDPPSFVEPPNQLFPPVHDPDELLGMVQAYAGQVALLDMCLGGWLDALEAQPQAADTLLLVTSPRGYPLGEHRRVGPCDEALYGELLQVPVLLRMPGLEPARTQRIMQPRDLYEQLGHAGGWLAPGAPGRIGDGNDWPLGTTASEAAYVAGQDQQAIRTRAWFLRRFQSEGAWQHELFAKPDDRWESNEVASRCGDVVELLAAELDRFTASRGENASAVASLPEVLCDIWR
jgi:hypothetical protein